MKCLLKSYTKIAAAVHDMGSTLLPGNNDVAGRKITVYNNVHTGISAKHLNNINTSVVEKKLFLETNFYRSKCQKL